MKLKAAITEGADQAIIDAFGSQRFATEFLMEVAEGHLWVNSALRRPAAFYVQKPDVTVNVGGGFGVELRLTGASRSGRTPKQFHEAIQALYNLAVCTISGELAVSGSESRFQLFVVIMLDGQVETAPGSNRYSNVLESPETWVTKDGIEKDGSDDE